MGIVKHRSASETDESNAKQEPQVEEARSGTQETSPTGQAEKSLVMSDEEKKLIKKLDRRILPIACLMYFLAYLDRTNLGNARLQGLPEGALHGDPTGVLFDWVNSAFFFSYVLFQIPASVMAKLYPPHIWLGAAGIAWGTCSTLMAAAFNFAGLMVARISLGVSEAGFALGIPIYFSLFYTKHEMGLRMAFWFSFAAISGMLGGLIAFGVQHIDAAVENWRILFIIEGIPAVLMGLVAMLFLPNRPEMTHFLNEDERKIAINRMNRAISGDIGFVMKKAHVWAALKDWRIYTAGVILVGPNCALVSIAAFLPTFINTFDFASQPAIAQLLTIPPYAMAAVVLTLTSYASDRAQHRGCFMAAGSAVSGIGYLILLMVKNVGVRYFAVFCITSGTYTTIGLIIAWFAHNLGSETKRAMGIPMFTAIGQCGSILGSHIYPATDGPSYIKGFAVTCALECLSMICVLVLSFSYVMENRRRDRLHGTPNPEAKVDVSELADKAPMFRYLA